MQHLAGVRAVISELRLWHSLSRNIISHDVLLLDAETNQRICFLNVTPDEVIRSLFYNKNNDSLITVSVYASDNYSSLKCRSTRIEYVALLFFLFSISRRNQRE